MEGVIVDAPYEYMTTRRGVSYGVICYHKQNGIEMIFKVTAGSNNIIKGQIKKMEKGQIITFYGTVLFFKKTKGLAHQFIIVSPDRIRILDVDVDYGKGLLEEADLSEVEALKGVTLPWER